MHLINTLAWRNLTQHRLRTILSALAVALAVATMVAADVTGDAIRNAGQVVAESQATVSFAGDFLNSALSVIGLVILAAAGFLIFNAFGMAVTQRQCQIGALRSLCMTGRQIMGLILMEAFFTGGGGALLGLVTGPLLGRGLVFLLGDLAGVAYGQSGVPPSSLLRAAFLGLAVPLLVTAIPARRAMRIPPLVALRPEMRFSQEAWSLRQAALGLVLLALLLVFLLVNPPAGSVLAPPWDILLTGLFALGWLMGLGLVLPSLVSGVSNGVRRISVRWGTVERLAADNLIRARRRVTLTILTLTIGLMMIVGVTGMTTFSFDVIVNYAIGNYDIDWIVVPLSAFTGDSLVNWEILSKWDPTTNQLTSELIDDLEMATAGRVNLVRVRSAFLPELAILSGLPSFVADPAELRRARLFTFAEGDWETAQTIMESGCGLLLTPRMAHQHDVSLYDTLALSGVEGPVTCTVAGLGTSSFLGTSVISSAAGPALGANPDQVFVVLVQTRPGVDREGLRSDLENLLSEYSDGSLLEVEVFFQDVSGLVDSLQVMLNGMLLLAIFAAALGVVNTTMISLNERRTELGLLRAVGATRWQVMRVVAGEAALMGLIGGGLGLVAGLGLVVVFATVNGGSMFGLSDFPLWTSLWASLQPAILGGIIGLFCAPLICAGAAWLPARALLQGTVIENLGGDSRTL
jgi:putative ABC transport system permease protein